MKPTKGQAGFNLSKDHLIFAQVLKGKNYATAVCGKWQLHGTMREYGLDEHCMWAAKAHKDFDGPVESEELRGQRGAYIGRAARYWHPSIVKNDKPVATTERDYGPDIFVEFLLEFARRHKDEPFLIYYPMCLTHASWDFEAGRSGYLPVPEVDAHGKKTGRKVRGSLKSNVEYTDRLVGRIVKGLEKLGIRDRTVFMFTCDNGTAGYGKSKLEMEKGPLVPMIVNCPGRIKAVGPSDELIDFSDVLPTLADLAGAALPKDYVIDGRSFAPVLAGKKGPRQWIFSVFTDKRFLRDKRWLLDGRGRFYDCGNNRTGEGYKDVTNSTDPEVVAARKRFAQILEDLPAPGEDDPILKRYRKMQQKRNKARPAGRK
jgi:arylsulfatase A